MRFEISRQSIELPVFGSSVTLIYKFDKKDSNNYNQIENQFQWQTSMGATATKG